MILNLRGGGGSGKSYVHHHLIDTYAAEGLHAPNFRTSNPQKPVVWRLRGDLYALGRYQPGGDGLRFGPLMALVEAFARRGHVFFENVLVSGNVDGWLALRRERLGDVPWVWATLDTPEELCLARIYERNGGTPIKEGVHSAHHRRVHRCHSRLMDAGEDTVLVDHARAIEHVEELLRAGGWSP